MSVLQKQLLDVRLLGLDEKANPRTAQAGTIVDGRNWTMDKEGRIAKRPGQSALAMLDTAGNTLTGRELAALNDELVLGDGKKWYGREPISGKWIARGAAAYERMDVTPMMATGATCNGVDSRLQMDSAQIGRYVLTTMSCVNGGPASDGANSGWVLTDSTTGEVLIALQSLLWIGVQVGDDGHVASPSFIGWGADYGYIKAGVWDNSAGHRTVSWVNIVTDMLYPAGDANEYTLMGGMASAAPYAVQRVADNVWLIAYQQTGGNLVVRKVTRTTGTTFTVSAAATVNAIGDTVAAVIAWAYTAGDATAYLAATGGSFSPLNIEFVAVTISTLAMAGGTTTNPAAWNGGSVTTATCRGATGIRINGLPTYLFDVCSSWGGRAVWVWHAGDSDVTLLLADSGLLTQAFFPTVAASDEFGVGVCNVSTWQPSAFLLRIHQSAVPVNTWTIGAHLHNGDFAGRPMSQHLPNGGAILALGYYNNPVSLGGNGTVLVKMANLTATTHVTVGPPVQMADALLLPGALLKSYDGEHVTEAAFPLGPESIAAAEGTTGVVFNVSAAGALTTALAPVGSATDLTSAFDGFGNAVIPLATIAGLPGVASWPAGNVLIDIWLKIVNPTGGVTYNLIRSPGMLKEYGGANSWQTGSLAPVVLTGSWQRIQYAAAVAGATFTTATRLLFNVTATAAPGDGAVLHLAVGGTMAPTVTTPFPVLEVGTREYCACAAWTDASGRTQRSQIAPAVSAVNALGLAYSITVPMVNITERDTATNLDSAIHPAVIEIYRTPISSPTFYRVASVTNVVNGADVTVTDPLPDTAITGNEQLYTTGGVVENWPPVGCNLVASHQGRVFVADAAGNVFFTAYAQSGEGLAFAAEYQAETEHLNGTRTALLSLDDKLVITTGNSYAVLSGVGPESTGTPAYDSPMLVGSGIGPLSQRACARTPVGIVAVTAHGAQMFDRGLGLTYVGIQEETDVPDSVNWYAAVFLPTKNQVRLSADSLVTVYDWTISGPPGRQSQFFKWAYNTTIVAYAIASSALYQLGANGTVYTADVGTVDGSTAYQEYVQFSVVSPAGPNGWGRIYAMRLACNVTLSSVLKVVFSSEEGNLSSTDTNTITATAAIQHVITKPLYGKCSSMTIWVGENAASVNGGITIDAIGLLVGNKGGLGRMPSAQRMTRS